MSGYERAAPRRVVEWPTLGLIALCYLVWGAATFWADAMTLWLAIPLATLAITLHSSLQHEVIHGHPLPSRFWSAALVFLPIGLFVPYERFRDTHLAHHTDATLTDPYEDPESNYLDPSAWALLPRWWRAVLRFNNTLAGRLLIGPALSIWRMLRVDLRMVRAADRTIPRAYALHALGLVPVIAWLALAGTMPWWSCLLAAYAGFSILKIRTFLEHQAHERVSGRSVIIEDRGPLALLFLNNNFHAVHHARPRMPWYEIPGHFRKKRDEYLKRNHGYRFASYGEVFRSHFLRSKDPVPHPLFEPRKPG